MATQTVHTAPLAGAEACRVMLASLAALRRIKVEADPNLADGQDDGSRFDYAGADRAIASALDAYSDNVGFRHALSHYLLSIMMDGLVPDPFALQADAMLTDDGYRPGGVSVEEVADVLTVQPERVRAGLQACWEIEVLCEAAREVASKISRVSDGDQDTLHRHALHLRGLMCRIEELNTATMSVLDDDDETRAIQQKVFGYVTA